MKRTRLGPTIAMLCAAALAAQAPVSIAAASNIGSVAPALGAAFASKYPAYRAEFTFGASGALATQILNGSPAELFLSADMAGPQKLVEADVASGPVRVYAVGSLILLSTKRLDLRKGLAVLADRELVQIANANPETAPYGRAAEEALSRAGLLEMVRPKLVMAQNVTQALQFTLTATDAGFVNKSALHSSEVRPYDQEGVYWIAIDPRLYSPIEQGFIIIKDAALRPGVVAFAKFLESAEARTIFASFGYGMP